eukprot:1137068-Pelagomonas_calceolata.AAC.7
MVSSLSLPPLRFPLTQACCAYKTPAHPHAGSSGSLRFMSTSSPTLPHLQLLTTPSPTPPHTHPMSTSSSTHLRASSSGSSRLMSTSAMQMPSADSCSGDSWAAWSMSSRARGWAASCMPTPMRPRIRSMARSATMPKGAAAGTPMHKSNEEG